jgi:hypothetical protein
LRFHWDPTFERADRIERLIASLHSGEAPQVSSIDAGDEIDADEIDADDEGEEDAPE